MATALSAEMLETFSNQHNFSVKTKVLEISYILIARSPEYKDFPWLLSGIEVMPTVNIIFWTLSTL
jgi:hypothetical protein